MRNSVFTNFTSIESIAVHIECNTYEPLNILNEFIVHVASQLQNIRKCFVESKHNTTMYGIHKLLENIPQIQVFDIAQVNMRQIPAQMLQIVKNRQQLINAGEMEPTKSKTAKYT